MSYTISHTFFLMQAVEERQKSMTAAGMNAAGLTITKKECGRRGSSTTAVVPRKSCASFVSCGGGDTAMSGWARRSRDIAEM